MAISNPEIDKAYCRLAAAIVVRAAMDYDATIERLALFPKDKRAKELKDDAETFLKGPWCSFLAPDIDGNVLLDRIRRRHREKV